MFGGNVAQQIGDILLSNDSVCHPISDMAGDVKKKCYYMILFVILLVMSQSDRQVGKEVDEDQILQVLDLKLVQYIY